MLPDRSILDRFAAPGLAGRFVDVGWQSDNRRYELIEPAGRGQTGITWRARDSVRRTFALKFVLRADYASHSLDAETQRANAVESPLFAKINFFGEPQFQPTEPGTSSLYAIAVDWVEGTSLCAFLKDRSTVIAPQLFLRFARDLCEVLQSLQNAHLCHGDLHDHNIFVRPSTDALEGTKSLRLMVIDSGQLKTEGRRQELLDQWQKQLDALEAVAADDTSLREAVAQHRERINYFRRTDQEWIVHHLCSLYNRMRSMLHALDSSEKRFVRDLPTLLQLMVDPDASRRVADPKRMFENIRLLQQSSRPNTKAMMSPFDLPSAELIRSDRELMALFSDEYPRLEACRAVGPIYLYGPRGCGKSTILRSLSISAILESASPADEFAKSPFLGVYMSASQELRSRFWLMQEPDFDVLEGHLVQYFNSLLLESLAHALDLIFSWNHAGRTEINFSMDEDIGATCVNAIRDRMGLDSESGRYAGVSHFAMLRDDLRRSRDALWLRILDRGESRQRADAQLIFDVCQKIEDVWSFARDHRFVFLIDDYSNQRIPVGLQKRLNQAITFSKQGSPIFKVTSEYDGVNLEGVQAGREVIEVNIGYEYVSLQRADRHRFLQRMLERRFAYLEHPVDLSSVLPLSGIEPATAMAREIRNAKQQHKKFFYNGLDTISDVCSGDFAMGIDLIHRIFDKAKIDWRTPKRISRSVQNSVIRDVARHELEHIRYQSRDGRAKYAIADRLCWLSKECILTKDTTKDDETIPVVKNHLDIAETALRELERDYPEQALLFQDLVSRGVLFPLQASRAREARDATYRVMVRRILLALYTTALGRHHPIRIDNVQRLLWLLQEPGEFVKDELKNTSRADAESQTQTQTQRDLGFRDMDEGNG